MTETRRNSTCAYAAREVSGDETKGAFMVEAKETEGKVEFVRVNYAEGALVAEEERWTRRRRKAG